MNFIKIKVNGCSGSGEEELINLDLIAVIHKEDRNTDWKEPYGIHFSAHTTYYEQYFQSEEIRDKVFDEVAKRLLK
jgi:hypothetical protein